MAENKGNRDKVKHYKNSKLLTHNQVVPGSSPGGTTLKIKGLQ